MTAGVAHIIAILDLPRPYGDRLTYARNVLRCMTGNADVPNPTPTMVVFKADVDAFEAAEALALTRAVGAADDRDLKWGVVSRDLSYLLHCAQVAADADPPRAVVIIEGCGFHVQAASSFIKEVIAVKRGLTEATARLDARAVDGALTYHWEQGLDGVTFTELPFTAVAHLDITGLVLGQVYYYRVRVFTRDGWTDYSPVVKFRAY